MKGVYYRITMNSAIIALAALVVTIGRGGPSVNGAALMTYLFRPAVVLVLGLLVAACGGGGPSLPGSSPAPLPGPPKDLDFEITPLNEVLLTWAAPVPEPGRAPVTGYEVYLDEQARPVGVTGSLSYLYRGLVPGRTYVFHVRAVNRVGRSQAAGSVTVSVIGVLILPPGPPNNLTFELTSHNDALLQWTVPLTFPGQAPFTHFVVYREMPGGEVLEIGESQSLSYLHPGLERGERYVFHVRAGSGAGLGRPSRSVFIDVPLEPTAMLPPAAPEGFTATRTPDNDVQFEWTAPIPESNRAPVEGYLVYEVVSGVTPRILNPGGTPVDALTYLHDPAPPLVPGQRYTYYVRATSAEGTSPPSASDFVEVPFDPLVPLSIPHVTVRADQSGSDYKEVTVSWVHNLLPALQSLVTGFELQYCEVAPDHATDHCPPNDHCPE